MSSHINISSVGRTNCKLLILDCLKDRHIMIYLKGVFESNHSLMNDDYIHIFPWISECSKGDKLYIAITFNSFNEELEPLQMIHAHNIAGICGWAYVHFKNTTKSLGNQTIAYISEIIISEPLQKRGIGSGIIDKIYEENIDFIELLSVESAKLFYNKIGFESYSDEIDTIFKTKNNKPTKEYIDSLIPKTPKIYKNFDITNIYKIYNK